MVLHRIPFALVALTGILAACGGAVAPDTGPGSSSSSGASGSSSSGSSSSSGGSSSGWTSSSGGSSSSSGGVCVDGQQGPAICHGCGYALGTSTCINGRWTCPVSMPCPPPPPACSGPAPRCACPSGCSCDTVCDPSTHDWTCSTSCPTLDAGSSGTFACGGQDCQPGEFCTMSSDDMALPDGGLPPIKYQCIPAPSACIGNDTCACVLPALTQGNFVCYPSSCNDAFGNPVVTCAGG